MRLLESDPKRGPFQGTLASSMYGGFVANSSCGNKCIRGIFGQQDLARWAVRVKSVDGETILERPDMRQVQFEFYSLVVHGYFVGFIRCG